MSNLTDLLPSGAGGKQVSFTATGAIPAGTPVGLNSDGTVSIMEGSVGSETNIVTSQDRAESISAAFDSTSGKVVVAYQDIDNSNAGMAVVGTVSGSTITFGTPVQFDSEGRAPVVVIDENENKPVILYQRNDANRGSVIVGTISGESIAFNGSVVNFISNQISTLRAVYSAHLQKVVAIFGDAGNSYYGTIIPMSVSGNSVTVHNQTVFNSGGISGGCAAAYDSDQQRTIISFVNDFSTAKVIAGQCTGAAFSFGTAVEYLAGQAESHAAAFDSGNNKTVITFRDQTNSGKMSGVVVTTSDTTVTVGSVVALESTPTYPTDRRHPGLSYNPDSGNFLNVWRGAHGYAQTVTVSGTSLTAGDVIQWRTNGNADGEASRFPAVTYDTAANKHVLITQDKDTDVVLAQIFIGGLATTSFVGIADEAISNGASGKVTLKGGVASNGLSVAAALTAGSQVVFNSGDSTTGIASAVDPDNNKIIHSYGDASAKAIVGTVSGTSISYGTEAVVHTNNAGGITDVAYDTGQDKAVIVYKDSGSSLLYARVASISGDSISLGTAVVFYSGNGGPIKICYDANSGKVLIAYKQSGTPKYGKAIVGTVSGTDITFGTAATFHTGGINQLGISYDAYANKSVIMWDDSDNTAGACIVATISGTDVTFGTKANFLNEQPEGNSIDITYNSTDQNHVLIYSKSSDTKGYAAIGTISGTDISFAGEAEYSSDTTTNYAQVAYKSTGNMVGIIYNHAGSSNPLKFLTGEISGTSFTFSSTVNLDDETNIDTSAVVVDGPTGNFVASYRDESNSPGVGTTNVVSADTTLAEGSTYYVQSDGSLGATSTSVTAGKALSSTSINLEYNS